MTKVLNASDSLELEHRHVPMHCVQKSIIYKSQRPQKPSIQWKPLHKKIHPPPTVSLYQFGPLRYEQKGKQSQFLGNIDYWVIAEMV